MWVVGALHPTRSVLVSFLVAASSTRENSEYQPDSEMKSFTVSQSDRLLVMSSAVLPLLPPNLPSWLEPRSRHSSAQPLAGSQGGNAALNLPRWLHFSPFIRLLCPCRDELIGVTEKLFFRLSWSLKQAMQPDLHPAELTVFPGCSP